MSVHLDWANQEKTAILCSLVGRWTWGEIDDAQKIGGRLLESVDQTVDMICDVTRMSILPPDVISRVKAHYLELPPKFGHLILVGADANLQLFWNTFTTLPYAAPLKALYFDTLDEALKFVKDERGG